MSIKVAVVDDEPLAIELLCQRLNQYSDLEIIARCKNGREAIDVIEKMRPDAVFLDIQMPSFTGLDVVARLQGDTMPLIVFATAYDQYALDAFEHNAVDYILKPIDPARLQVTVQRLRDRLLQQEREEFKSPVINAIAQIQREVKNKDLYSRKLAIKDGGEITLLPVEQIQWVDAAGDYMCVHANGDTYIMRITMKELCDKLCPPHFQRIHRSTIVNLRAIESVSILPKGEAEICLNGGAKLKVSRSYRQNIQSLLH
jgi:two-component system LytT family response regulator